MYVGVEVGVVHSVFDKALELSYGVQHMAGTSEKQFFLDHKAHIRVLIPNDVTMLWPSPRYG